MTSSTTTIGNRPHNNTYKCSILQYWHWRLMNLDRAPLQNSFSFLLAWSRCFCLTACFLEVLSISCNSIWRERGCSKHSLIMLKTLLSIQICLNMWRKRFTYTWRRFKGRSLHKKNWNSFTVCWRLNYSRKLVLRFSRKWSCWILE